MVQFIRLAEIKRGPGILLHKDLVSSSKVFLLSLGLFQQGTPFGTGHHGIKRVPAGLFSLRRWEDVMYTLGRGTKELFFSCSSLILFEGKPPPRTVCANQKTSLQVSFNHKISPHFALDC